MTDPATTNWQSSIRFTLQRDRRGFVRLGPSLWGLRDRVEAPAVPAPAENPTAAAVSAPVEAAAAVAMPAEPTVEFVPTITSQPTPSHGGSLRRIVIGTGLVLGATLLHRWHRSSQGPSLG